MSGTHDIARAAGLKDTEVKTLFSAILADVKAGNRVLIKDFGTFELKHVKERMIKSPQIPNGEAKVEAHDVIKFRPSPATKVMLNGGDVPAPAEKPAAAPKKAAPAAPAAAKPAAAKPAAPKAAAPAAAKPAPAPAKKPAPKPAPVAADETEATE